MKNNLSRPFNFSAGPSTIPLSVLGILKEGISDWNGSGIGVMEMSHRSEAFLSILYRTKDSLRQILKIPSRFEILFLHGGATSENAAVPLNISQGQQADFILTGHWSKRSYLEASKYLSKANVAANSELESYSVIPPLREWSLSSEAAYVHLCSNETIHGVQFHELPNLHTLGSNASLVIDCSSDIASKPFDWDTIDLAYAGTQKNLGAAGLTIVIIDEKLLGKALPICPDVFNYTLLAANNSMLNTPPTWSIYVLNKMLDWIQNQREGNFSGVEALEIRNKRKAYKLYETIDESHFYHNRIHNMFRSQMNVPFTLYDESLTSKFLEGAEQRGLFNIKGHKAVGGIRASIYNAFPEEGVDALIEYMRDFEKKA